MAFYAAVTTVDANRGSDRWECDHVHRGYDQAMKCALKETRRLIGSNRDLDRYGAPFTFIAATARHVIPHEYK